MARDAVAEAVATVLRTSCAYDGCPGDDALRGIADVIADIVDELAIGWVEDVDVRAVVERHWDTGP